MLVSFYDFYYELILGNLSCGNSVWPGLRINFSKSGARGSPIRGCFRLENSVCGFLALTKAVNTGPDSRKGLPVTTNSKGLFSPPFHPEPRVRWTSFPVSFLKVYPFPERPVLRVGGGEGSTPLPPHVGLKLLSLSFGCAHLGYEDTQRLQGSLCSLDSCSHLVPGLWKVPIPFLQAQSFHLTACV